MRKAAIVVFAAAAMIGTPAAAADMPVKAAPAPIVDPWTGFYVGVNGGYSWASWNSTSIASIFPPTFMSFTASPHVDG
jgi:opacity protein-like surface antigen